MLSRNFRLQRVGNLEWLQSNYNFSQISYSIDELVVLDVTRGEKSLDEFCLVLKKLTEGCFIPIVAGGGIRNIESARKLLRSGADKVIINSSLYEENGFTHHLASEFGRQCIVASMDLKVTSSGSYQVWSECGSRCIDGSAVDWVNRVLHDEVGELYMNSMDRDGTGLGYDFGILGLLPADISKPVILAGGVGNANHLLEGLKDPRVDGVATAHLFNFIGDGLAKARKSLMLSGIDLPFWDVQFFQQDLGDKKVRSD